MNKIIKVLEEKGIVEKIKSTYEFAKEIGLWNEKGEKALLSVISDNVGQLGEEFIDEFTDYIIQNGYRGLYKELGFDEASKKELTESDVEKALKIAILSVMKDLKNLFK